MSAHTVHVQAVEKGRYAKPSLDGYVLERTKMLDKSPAPDGENETLVEIYVRDGRYILRYLYDGREWAFGIIGNVQGGPADERNNFAVRDSDGDGLYDERYVGEEEFFLPEWLHHLKQA